MRHSSRMKSLITKMAKVRGKDLSKIATHFKAKSDGFMDLVVEVVDANLVSVAHYYEQNHDLIQDPEVVFWMCPIDDNWYPIEWTTPPGYYEKSLWLNDDNTAYEEADIQAQAELAIFGNKWSTNLRRQGFE